MSATTSATADTLALSGVLDAASVVALQAEGRAWLAACVAPVCRLDLSAVGYSSSAGLALLLDWLRAAAASGKTLRIDNMPADMVALARVSGLDAMLPLD